jgi:hypothetical protein
VLTELHQLHHTHKRNPFDSIASHPYPQKKSVERFGFVHDIISRPEKGRKKQKTPPFLGMEQGTKFTADGVCGMETQVCVWLGDGDSVCLLSFKAKALCLFSSSILSSDCASGNHQPLYLIQHVSSNTGNLCKSLLQIKNRS